MGWVGVGPVSAPGSVVRVRMRVRVGVGSDHVAEREVVHGVVHELLVEEHPLLEGHVASAQELAETPL